MKECICILSVNPCLCLDPKPNILCTYISSSDKTWQLQAWKWLFQTKQLTLKCSDSDLSSVNSEADRDHSTDDDTVTDTSVNDVNDYNTAEGNFVWEGK
jgi:hypothetical protein